ncbi:MAG: hypothetical protein WB817_17980, partial [Terriglobales bacterium]
MKLSVSSKLNVRCLNPTPVSKLNVRFKTQRPFQTQRSFQQPFRRFKLLPPQNSPGFFMSAPASPSALHHQGQTLQFAFNDRQRASRHLD